jgi:dTDP-4-amino-4,6-dideoxygalactose transaminase
MAAPVLAFLDLKAVNARYRAGYEAALARVLDSGQFLLGEETASFEREFARYCGVAHCITVGNGLDALQLTLRAWGIGAGDEVIVPSHTFIATWLAVSHAGATPVPVEPQEHSFNLDPARVEAAITPRTRAIVPVHLYGRAADMSALRDVAQRHGLRLLEDAAQAHGARHQGKRCGALGDAAGFSFYPGKNLGALGDAGAVTTDDAQLAKRVRLLRNYGSRMKYEHEAAGFNSRTDELQAAFLRERLRGLDDDNARRRIVAAEYLEALRGVAGLTLPEHDPQGEPVWHVFVVRHSKRDQLARALAERGVVTLIHYPLPPHRQGAYAQTPLAGCEVPLAESLARDVLSLPMGPTLSEGDVQRVCQAVTDACAALR